MGSHTGARILLAIAFLAAMFGYEGFVASRTVLDPNATTDLARALLATSTVQHSLDDQLNTQVDQSLDRSEADAQVAAAVRHAVRDPRVVDAFVQALRAAHAALLSDSNGTVTLDGRALTTAVQDALAPLDQKLAADLARRPPLQVKFNADQLPHLGHARDVAHNVALLGTIAALLLLTASLLMVHDRGAIARVGRRTAYIAIVPLLVFALGPRLLAGARGGAPEIAGAALRTYGGRVVPSAVALVVVGLVVAMGALLAPASTEVRVPPAPAPEPQPRPAPAPPARIEEHLYL
jgi:hypothetical protein